MGRIRHRALRTTLAALMLTGVPMLTACEWFSDFKRQPSLWTWEPVGCAGKYAGCDTTGIAHDSTVPSRGNPQFSVSVYGTARSALETSYTPLPGVVDSMSGLSNPTPISPASLENGHKYYEINCAVCHGDKGMGDGPATKYGMVGISLISEPALSRADGYIYGMIRNGRGAMPTYNRIEEMDRWDVVNYVRGLQGKSPIAVATGPLAAPGVTGRWVPGHTVTAPTNPAPFVPPAEGSAKTYYPDGGKPTINPNSPTVGPALLDSNSYKTGHVQQRSQQ